MKKFVLEFLKRGLMAAAGGPVILAIIYGNLGATGAAQSFSPHEVSMGILTATLMAFIAGGISVVYQIERLPLLTATMIHAVTLYADYLLVYLLNNWIPREPVVICVFTAIYAGSYALIWLFIYLSTRFRAARINKELRRKNP